MHKRDKNYWWMMSASLEQSKVFFRRRETVIANPDSCSGCRICQMICSLTHEGAIEIERSRIRVSSDPFRGASTIVVCRQCHDAPCYYACPESAIELDQTNGAVVIDEERCTGCRTCEEACPFDAILFFEEDGKAYKCDLCGGDPECVKWCPMSSLGISVFGGELA